VPNVPIKKRPALIVSAALIVLMSQLPFLLASRGADYRWFDPILDIRHHLSESFVEPLRDEDMQRSMIAGMIESLDDPYTEFVAADEAAFNKDLRGTYVGIGAEVRIVEDYLTIVSPMAGSPALESGILAGDTVLEIEGVSTYKLPVEACIDKMMGEPGTPVTLHVRHQDGVEQDVTLIRRRITTQTVRGVRRIGEPWDFCLDAASGLFYLRVTQFNDTTTRETLNALRDIGTERIRGLVLDLRDNPGGSLGVAIEMADLFLEDGLIVAVKDRDGEGERWKARPDTPLPAFPVLVLVNQQSASASEIVAGALQANGRAKVMGMRTFGKGSVQEVRELPDHRGTLKLTVAHYHLANDRVIHRRTDSETWGVDPDPGLVVRVADEDYRKKLLASREFEVIRKPHDAARDAPCAGAAWIREHLLDEQLARAAEAMQQRLATGAWPDGEGEDPAAANAAVERQRLVAVRSRMLDQLGEVERRIAATAVANAADLDKTAASLLPKDADLVAGTITLRNKDDQVIGTFRIDGGDVESALRRIDLKPVTQ
jgi:carboxyl-terminal processing protease